MNSIAERIASANGPSREIDWAIAYALGLGTATERKVWEEKGPSGFSSKDNFGLSALDHANGCYVRYSRAGREGRRTAIRGGEAFRVITGEQPLSRCPAWTSSIGDATSLIECHIPERSYWTIARGKLSPEEPMFACELRLVNSPEAEGIIAEHDGSAPMAMVLAFAKARGL
jgi:hypothetical protein